MPCSDGGWGRGEERDYYERQRGETQAKLDNVTRMLCELCFHMELTKRSDLFAHVKGLKGWWVGHKRRDQERLVREQVEQEQEREEARQRALRQTALNKLTDEERKALKLQ